MAVYQIGPEQIKLFNEFLRLDKETGRLFWKKKICDRMMVGDEAGSVRKLGYRIVSIKGERYLSHRIIFAMCNGYCPEEVDHINGKPEDNRPENLRPANRSQQNMNRAIQANNTSGHKGVYWYKPKGYWCARIKVNGKYIGLGYFREIEAAANAYRLGAEKYHGEFRRAF